MFGRQMKARKAEQFLLYFLYMNTSCVLEGNKKEPEEWQADKFAAFLLMPSVLVKKAFHKNYNKPVNVRRKSILQIFFPKPAFVKGYRIAEEVIRSGKFDNVSKMAMLNRLIGMRLVKGLSYQKSITTQ